MEQTINTFDTISLAEMDGAKLMNRIDRKYCFDLNLLKELLSGIQNNYYILMIDGQKSQEYTTHYFDTCNDSMYLSHHNGKLNRYKIRRRHYLLTNSCYLEVKFKNNKGRTIKKRLISSLEYENQNIAENQFIEKHSPYTFSELQNVLTTRFRRIMLVSKEMNERCTIDLDLNFIGNEQNVKLEHFVILEVKSEKGVESCIAKHLKNKRIKPTGFSKYCMGRSITNPALKSNLFKTKYRKINPYINLH